MRLEEIARKIEFVLAMAADVARRYQEQNPDEDDADDYVECMEILESLVRREGVDHRDLVHSLRYPSAVRINGRSVVASGNRDTACQISKLRASSNPLYLATSGITNGAAMHAIAPALFYPSFEEFVYNCDFISQITHDSDESRLAAIAVGLRIREGLLSKENSSFASNLKQARHMLAIRPMVHSKENRLIMEFSEAINSKLSLEVFGFKHHACSSPVTAIRCSYSRDIISIEIPQNQHSLERAERIDADTFFFMLDTMRAANDLYTEDEQTKIIETNEKAFFHNWRPLAMKIAQRWAH